MYKPIKELGQNFLIDPIIPIKMVNYLNISEDDCVVEIGPGLGALTEILSERLIDEASEIHAIEIDKRFVDKLAAMYEDNLNIDIIEGNILDWLPTFRPRESFKLIGSLPYYITSPIIHTIIKLQKRPDICVVLIQKEVAERICSEPHDESYMSIFVKTFFNVEKLDVIGRQKFDPQPSVDGQIMRMTQIPNPLVPSEAISKYEGFLHKGFSNPRKMLNKVFSKEELTKADLDGNLRPQDVNAEKWVEMFNILVLNKTAD